MSIRRDAPAFSAAAGATAPSSRLRAVLQAGLLDTGMPKRAGEEDPEGWAMKLRKYSTYGDIEVVKELIAAIDAKDLYGRTREPHLLLVRHIPGANIDAKDSYGRTALMWASYSGHADVVKTLIGARADIDAKDSEGRTALWWATKLERADVVKTLMETKEYINAVQREVRELAMVAHNTKYGAKFAVEIDGRGKETLKGEVGIIFSGNTVTPWWDIVGDRRDPYIQMCDASYPDEYCGDFQEVPHYHETLEDLKKDVRRTMELLSKAQKTNDNHYKITV